MSDSRRAVRRNTCRMREMPAHRKTVSPRVRRRCRRVRRRMFAFALLMLAALGGLRAVCGAILPSAETSAIPQSDKPTEETRYKIAIDPGHGGSDHGSSGLGFMEDEMTWKTANLLAELLEQDGRFDPFLTMSEAQMKDPYTRVKPSQRGAYARSQGAELLLSIHGNSDPVYDSSGFECFPVPPGLLFHEDSQRFAELVAEGFQRDGQKLRGVNGVRYLYYDENDDKIIIESGSTKMSGTPTFTLLEDCGCPAVLAEQCFITNSGDAARYAGQTGCARAARLYYRAICEYYGLEPAENE